MAKWSDAFDSITLSILQKVAYFVGFKLGKQLLKKVARRTKMEYYAKCGISIPSYFGRNKYSSTEFGATEYVIL